MARTSRSVNISDSDYAHGFKCILDVEKAKRPLLFDEEIHYIVPETGSEEFYC